RGDARHASPNPGRYRTHVLISSPGGRSKGVRGMSLSVTESFTAGWIRGQTGVPEHGSRGAGHPAPDGEDLASSAGRVAVDLHPRPRVPTLLSLTCPPREGATPPGVVGATQVVGAICSVARRRAERDAQLIAAVADLVVTCREGVLAE